MKRDLWKELAEEARLEPTPALDMPFGMEGAVLSKVRGRRESSPFGNLWLPVLRPALVLAVGVMGVCLAIQVSTNSQQRESDLLGETEALLTSAVFR